MIVDSVTIHKSEYPKLEPAAKLGSPVARIDESNGYQQTRTDKFEISDAPNTGR